jgi:hypothetical protein
LRLGTCNFHFTSAGAGFRRSLEQEVGRAANSLSLSTSILADPKLPAMLSFVSLAASAAAAPLVARQAITALSTTQINSYTPYTHYASTAYCSPASTLAWNCGANCNANPGFKPIASGGDGGGTQYWYVGWDPTLKTVIVAHQGTDTSQMQELQRSRVSVNLLTSS